LFQISFDRFAHLFGRNLYVPEVAFVQRFANK
jgi:hypothetical protein